MKLLRWLQSEGASRWEMILGAILVFALNGAVSLVALYWQQQNSLQAEQRAVAYALEAEKRSVENARLAEQRADLAARSAEVRLAAVDFQTYAGNYVQAILDGGDDLSDTRKALYENIARQFATIELSEPTFAPEVRGVAGSYRQSLIEFNDALADATTILEMRPFWEAASNVLYNRDRFLDALEHHS